MRRHPANFKHGKGRKTATPALLGYTIQSQTTEDFTIAWTTNVACDSGVNYGETSSLGSFAGDGSYVTDHSVTIVGASAGDIFFTLTSKNASGEFTSGVYQTTISAVTTPPTGPAILNIAQIGLSSTSAEYEWYNSPAASARIEYGKTTALGEFTALQVAPLTYHSQTMSPLDSGTTYYFQIVASADGVTTRSPMQSFITNSVVVPPVETGDFPTTVNPLTYTALVTSSSPAFREIYNDPTYSTEVTCASDSAGTFHRYSSKSAWNCDESLLLLDGASPRDVMDGQSLVLKAANQGTGTYFCWSNTNPSKGFAGGSNTGDPATSTMHNLRRYSANLTTGVLGIAYITIFDGSGGRPNWKTQNGMFFGGGQGTLSDDDNYMSVGWWATNNNYGLAILNMSVEPVTVYSTVTLGTTTSNPWESLVDHTMMSRTGAYMMVSFNTAGIGSQKGQWIYSTNMTPLYQIGYQQEHADWCLNRAGQDILVKRSGTNDEASTGVWMYNVTNGQKSVGVGGSGGTKLSSVGGIHISGRNILQRGWVLVSSDATSGTTPGDNVIVAYDVDNVGDARVFAHDHYTTLYSGDPAACFSPTGDRVIWRGQWESESGVKSWVAGKDAIRIPIAYTDYSVTAGITTLSGLQTYIDSVPDGTSATAHSRILLGAGRTYTGTTGINFTGRNHLTIDGGGTPTTYGHTGGAKISITSSSGSGYSAHAFHAKSSDTYVSASDIRFVNMTIEGNNTTYATTSVRGDNAYQHGISACGTDDLEVSHVIFDKLNGDGMYISDSLTGWASNGHPANRTWIHDSTIQNNGRMGIAIIWAVDTTIEDCKFTDMANDAFDMEPNQTWQGPQGTTTFQRNLITGNWSWDSVYGDPLIYIGNAGGGPGGTASGTIKILDNVINASHPDSPSAATIRFDYESGTWVKTAVVYVEGNDMTGYGRPAPAMRIKNFVNGGYVRNNTGFLSSGTDWVQDDGGNGTIVESGNT